MKRLLALSILLAALSFSFMGAFSWAEEGDDNRPVNPGKEPNEEITQDGAHVVAHGTGCPACDRRTYQQKMDRRSVPGQKGGPSNFTPETGNAGKTGTTR